MLLPFPAILSILLILSKTSREETTTRFNNALQYRFAFVRFKPNVLGKAPEVVHARIRAFSSHRQRLPAVRAFRPRKVVERRKRPTPLLVHQERKVLQMVVPVVRDDIEASAAKQLDFRRPVVRQGIRQPKEKRVFIARNPEIGMKKSRHTRHVDASTAVRAVETPCHEELARLRRDETACLDFRPSRKRRRSEEHTSDSSHKHRSRMPSSA